jgi:hypothetical protein
LTVPLIVFSVVIVNAAKEWWADAVDVVPRVRAIRPTAMTIVFISNP